MFEEIFKQATMELKLEKIEGGGTPQPTQKSSPRQQGQKASPPLAARKRTGLASRTEGPTRIDEGKTKAAKTAERSGAPQGRSERIETPAPAKSKPARGANLVKGSRNLKVTLLLLLLLVLAGFLANQFAVIDLALIPDLLGLGPKQSVQAPAPEKQKTMPPEKAATPPSQPQGPEKLSAAATSPRVSTPSAASKEEKLIELETPTTAQQPLPGKEKTEERAPSAAIRAQPATAQVAVKEESKPEQVLTQVPQKPPVAAVPPSKPKPSQYPYSAYLGSFKAPEAVKKALSDYQGKGVSAYWAKVDLGDKGVWYRFFAGYFRTKEEAEKYIRERDLQGASPGSTKYANLIGVYSSAQETETQKRALVTAGFYPYVIKDADGNSVVYSGAFDRKEYAEKEQGALTSKGFQNTVVER
ncbi:MAG: SPOR domain-containing protein [Deltaproteobacteria bacterium]